ncbi:G-protein coupled receptor Mth2-like isoform X3 [Leptidea sinapis]|uniref:G-protein coupled receptor Mth2-like isoform X3 n=1 Tax=Leptidea sinapis TaxID=189913 RepID=UPI0021C461AD|nr:G-protein coupled receptor Mth2-like isoform X3 [Leptidea sinapis]
MIVLLFISMLFLNVYGQLCDNITSVDLSDSAKFLDGSIVKNGIRFPPEYIFNSNTSGVVKVFGCPCKFMNCIRKCCPLGFVVSKRTCIKTFEDKIQKEGVNLYFMNTFKRTVNLENNEEFAVLTGRPSEEMYIEDDGEWFIQEDGKLYIELPTSIPPWVVRGPDKYCIDTFVVEDDKGNVKTSLDALVCFADEPDNDRYMLSSTCMLISCVFIIATVAVYCWLPELRNLHGRVLIAYLLCLLVGFVFMSSMQILLNMDNITQNGCLVLTFFSYFFLLSAFFWLNVMCFDIWWTFSGKRGISIERMSLRARFCAYALYAFGVPTALTVLLAALEFSNLPPHPLLPLIKEQGCFLYGKSKMLYFYGPILVLCVGNIVFFCLTAMKIAQIKKETSVLKSRESATHDSQSSDRRRLFLYVKLFIVMGINWILEIVSYLYPDLEILKFVDAYNVLIGLIIFIIFVCKKKILRMLKKRYRQNRGQAMSRSHTTSSRISTRDEIALTTVKN